MKITVDLPPSTLAKLRNTLGAERGLREPNANEQAALDAVLVRLIAAGEKKSLFRVKRGACRRCGCVEERACPGGCSWVQPDLCSACELPEDVK